MQYFTNGVTPLQQIQSVGSANYYSPFNIQNYGNRNFFNPYQIQQNYLRQQEYVRQVQREKQAQLAFARALSLEANNYVNPSFQMSEERINKFYSNGNDQQNNYNTRPDYFGNDVPYNPGMFSHPIHVECNGPFNSHAVDIINKRDAKIKKEYPDNMNLLEFMQKGGRLAYEVEAVEMKKKNKNLTHLYNRQSFNNMLNNINAINIDSGEIGLPQYINRVNQSIMEKKNRFIQQILANRKRGV